MQRGDSIWQGFEDEIAGFPHAFLDLFLTMQVNLVVVNSAILNFQEV